MKNTSQYLFIIISSFSYLIILTSATKIQQKEVQQCILQNTQTDIFGELNQIKLYCSQLECMNWFHTKSLNQYQSIEEIQECFQICGMQTESTVNEYIQEIIINGCILKEELEENYQIASENLEENKDNLRKQQQKEQQSSLFSQMISAIWGEFENYNKQKKNQEKTNKLQSQFGSWGSWGSWDSEDGFGYLAVDNQLYNSLEAGGLIHKTTTKEFIGNKDGEYGSVVYFEVTDQWEANAQLNKNIYGSTLFDFNSVPFIDKKYDQAYWQEVYRDIDATAAGELTHKTKFTLEEKIENQDKQKQQLEKKGLKVPKRFQEDDFGSTYEVTKVDETWEWGVDKYTDVDATNYFGGLIFGLF